MMRLLCSFLSGLVLLSVAMAQPTRWRVEIEEANFGLPPGRFIGEKDTTTQKSMPVVKPNTWAPLYLKLQVNKETEGGIAAVVRSVDGDGQFTTYTVPLLNNIGDRLPGTKIEPSELATIPYVRAANRIGTGPLITITIISTAKDTFGRQLSQEYRITSPGFRDASTFIVCSLGSRLPGFDLPNPVNKSQNDAGSSNRGALRNGRVETAAITNILEMPDQWVGYSGADLVVLTTGATPPDFLDSLFDPVKSRPYASRRNALLEWVRRGGSLLVSAGGNALQMSNSPLFRDLLPTRISPDTAVEAVPELLLSWTVSGTNVPATALRGRTPTFPVAKTAPIPGKPSRVLLTPKENAKLAELPLVSQMPYGLGRITFVAFDLDQSPFTEFSKRAEFWDYLLRNAHSERAALPSTTSRPNYGWGNSGFGSDAEDDFLSALRAHVDYFEGVPVISFGWVALFILLYTLLIGPVEYVVLKYVLRRLELTWITFPLIVLSVSAAAYFTAYALKGSDLRTNKVDLLDIDLGNNRIYGKSWFTLFSPRIDKYTLMVEPREEWVNPSSSEPPPLMDWMAGAAAQGSGGIVGREYSYQLGPNGEVAAGLKDVRIPVWSTKSFTADWTAATPTTPLIESFLVHPPANPDALSGSLRYNLPTPPVNNAVLFYRGVAYKLPTLTPGQLVTIGSVGADRGGLRSTLESDPNWFSTNAYSVGNPNSHSSNPWANPRYNQQQNVAVNAPLWTVLFHQRAIGDGRDQQNASLRRLDQSWRLSADNKDEAILVGQVAKMSGPAEEMMTQNPASPVRLWLKDLPGQDATGKPKTRPLVPGSLQQETYFRVIIPVPPALPNK